MSVANKKVFLDETMLSLFKEYTQNRIYQRSMNSRSYPHIERNWPNIDAFFNYCLKHKTWADFTGQCIVAGQIKCAGTNRIFCNDGRSIDTKQGIIEHTAAEYENDYIAWLGDNIFHNMFCEFEWLTRGQNDYAEKEYKKVFKIVA